MTATHDHPPLRLRSGVPEAATPADEDIRGRRVLDRAGQDIGRIDDLLLDDQHLRVRFLLVEHGGFAGLGRKTSVVPVDAITAVEPHTVRVDYTAGHVGSGPAHDPALVSDRAYLASVFEHYGTVPYWGVGYGYPSYPYYVEHRPRR